MSAPYFNGPLAHAVRRLYAGQGHPDPWAAEDDAAARDPNAVALCTNCLFPQPPHRWFCPHCAFPTGDHVALMPYLQIFVAGEALRRGVLGPPERRVGVQVFLVLYSCTQFLVFAPVYWLWMIRRAMGRPIGEERRAPWRIDRDAVQANGDSSPQDRHWFQP